MSEDEQIIIVMDNNSDAAEITDADIRAIIERFEAQFNMTSAEFLRLRALGEAPDTFETMLWKTLLKVDVHTL